MPPRKEFNALTFYTTEKRGWRTLIDVYYDAVSGTCKVENDGGTLRVSSGNAWAKTAIGIARANPGTPVVVPVNTQSVRGLYDIAVERNDTEETLNARIRQSLPFGRIY